MTEPTNGRAAGPAPNAVPRPEFVEAVGTALTAAGCANAVRHAEYLGPLSIAAQRFQIATKLRLAHWLAQLGHESEDFKRLVENLNYTTPAALKSAYGDRFATDALAAPYLRNPEALANLVYSQRNGNGGIASGDGWAYRGRGFIQLTGRANYRAAAVALNLPLESEPDIAAKPATAALVAGWFWVNNDLNREADRGEAAIGDITRRVNGKAKKGLADRHERFRTAIASIARWPETLVI